MDTSKKYQRPSAIRGEKSLSRVISLCSECPRQGPCRFSAGASRGAETPHGRAPTLNLSHRRGRKSLRKEKDAGCYGLFINAFVGCPPTGLLFKGIHPLHVPWDSASSASTAVATTTDRLLLFNQLFRLRVDLGMDKCIELGRRYQKRLVLQNKMTHGVEKSGEEEAKEIN